MSLHIFYKDEKWFGIIDMPVKPNFEGDYFLHYGPQKRYEKEFSEAVENAIPILNPEALKGISYLQLEKNLGYKYYQWGGEWEIANEMYMTNPPKPTGYKTIRLKLNESIKK